MTAVNAKVMWIQWITATIVAAVSGVFIIMTYNFAYFTSANEFQSHQKTIHSGAVSENRYNQDLKDLRSRIEANGKKLDSVLTLLLTTKRR